MERNNSLNCFPSGKPFSPRIPYKLRPTYICCLIDIYLNIFLVAPTSIHPQTRMTTSDFPATGSVYIAVPVAWTVPPFLPTVCWSEQETICSPYPKCTLVFPVSISLHISDLLLHWCSLSQLLALSSFLWLKVEKNDALSWPYGFYLGSLSPTKHFSNGHCASPHTIISCLGAHEVSPLLPLRPVLLLCNLIFILFEPQD